MDSSASLSLSRDFLQEEIQKMISDVDDDGSGTIGYEELLGKLGSPHSSLFSHRPARSRSIALSLSLHLLRATIIRLSVCLSVPELAAFLRFLKMMTHKILNRDPPLACLVLCQSNGSHARAAPALQGRMRSSRPSGSSMTTRPARSLSRT